MTKPLLLLDIDGVLCPLGAITDDLVRVRVGEAAVRYDPATPERLRRLGEAFRLVWATSWEDAANEELGPLLGLPPLPFLRFDDDVELGESYKLPAIRRYVGDRAAAYVDDDMGNDTIAWAAARTAPTLVLPIQADRGLQDDHVAQLLRFAAGCQ
ncbi:MAG: hypothetical protein QOF76_3451 [Solirubrobacteraceae bacterium]|nr:hypothetical protein [Solirubrobacteraceae bacterium]